MKQNSLNHNKNLSIRSSTKTIKNEDVYDMLLTIPKGKVSTYGDLAKALGNPFASRHVGRILSKNPNPIKVPCHRVVMSNGKIGGYALGTQKKKELLQNEGIIFADDYRLNEFSKVRYYPKKG
jgi:methylated-DNA-[protein]-cysteine S-methyltransferase